MPDINNETEYKRLIELSELDLDYSSLKENLEDLTQLAARIAGTEISLINLIDSYTQWSVANYGIDIQQMPREDSVCQHVVSGGDRIEIKDLKGDERFKDKFYVTDGPKLRYYYGVPLTTSRGINVGAMCVLDKRPQDVSPEAKELLAMIANQVIRRLEALKTIKSLEEKVQELNLSKRKVSHDIRSPISGIIGLAEIMKEEVKNGRMTEIIELLDVIQKGGESLLELTDSILNQEDRGTEPSDNEFSCETFAQKLRELYSPQAQTKQVILEIRTYDESRAICFSKNRLLQIVGNLVSNSIKFTPNKGKVGIEITVEMQDEDELADTLIVKVTDTGTGMSEAKKADILAGTAISERGTSGESGYGFGLSLVMHLINQTQGSIEINSEVGKGSRFEVRLPVYTGDRISLPLRA
jgi:signal transduction histidine kinase